MKAFLIEAETPSEAVEQLNQALDHYNGAPVTITWSGDLCNCVIMSNTEPESLLKKAKKAAPAAKAAKGGKEE
jgi:hypothetical protein